MDNVFSQKNQIEEYLIREGVPKARFILAQGDYQEPWVKQVKNNGILNE